jgi:hypothetical protein
MTVAASRIAPGLASASANFSAPPKQPNPPHSLHKYGAFAHHWRRTLKTRFFAGHFSQVWTHLAQVWALKHSALSTEHSATQTMITIGAMITIGEIRSKTQPPHPQ